MLTSLSGNLPQVKLFYDLSEPKLFSCGTLDCLRLMSQRQEAPVHTAKGRKLVQACNLIHQGLGNFFKKIWLMLNSRIYIIY